MHSTYNELVITTDEKFLELITDFVSNIYDDGIEITKNSIIISSQNDLSSVQDAILELKQSIGDGINLTCETTQKQNNDWVSSYKNSVQPIDTGKFYIHPSWDEPKADKINITIDPALAFGSGHHGTTFACLEAIGEYVKENNSVLDVGCGSGILGLAAQKLGAIVDLCDTDSVSVQSTKENFALNNAQFNNIWQGSVNQTDKKYDIVIANIVADVLKAIKAPLSKSLKSSGILILSGILDKKESLVTSSYDEFELLQRKQIDEWVTLIYKVV